MTPFRARTVPFDFTGMGVQGRNDVPTSAVSVVPVAGIVD
jgi:hypothetical protein